MSSISGPTHHLIQPIAQKQASYLKETTDFIIEKVTLSDSAILVSVDVTGRLSPEVQTLILLYTIFDRKGTLSVYLPQKRVPLSYTYEATLNKRSFE